jgi:group I intron endonuclease
MAAVWSEYKKPGVYMIRNKSNGHFYIGSAANLYMRRLHHLNDLRKGKHINQHLQRAWKKYGEDAFEFEVLMTCPRNLIRVHEQRFLDQLKPTYNMSNNAHGPAIGRVVSETTRAKLRERSGRFPGNRHAAKLDENKVREIKRLIAADKLRDVDIAKRFGVHRSVIGLIRAGKRWAEVSYG